MRTHELKTWTKPFEAVWEFRKTHEVRRDDRRFEVGDHVMLREFEHCVPCTGTGCDPAFVPSPWHSQGECPACGGTGGRYLGRAVLAEVTYITRESFGVPAGLAILSIRVLGRQHAPEPTTDKRCPCSSGCKSAECDRL